MTDASFARQLRTVRVGSTILTILGTLMIVGGIAYVFIEPMSGVMLLATGLFFSAFAELASAFCAFTERVLRALPEPKE